MFRRNKSVFSLTNVIKQVKRLRQWKNNSQKMWATLF